MLRLSNRVQFVSETSHAGIIRIGFEGISQPHQVEHPCFNSEIGTLSALNCKSSFGLRIGGGWKVPPRRLISGSELIPRSAMSSTPHMASLTILFKRAYLKGADQCRQLISEACELLTGLHRVLGAGRGPLDDDGNIVHVGSH